MAESENTKPKRSVRNFSDEEEDSQAWLLSYADLMTLIACFFILLVALAHFDPVGFQEKTKIIAQHFSKGQVKVSELKLKEIKNEITRHPELEKMTKITVSDSSLAITLSGTVLFPSNEVDLTPEMSVHLDSIIDIVKTFNPEFRILIEGHSDNLPIPSSIPYRNHWSLGAARAASIAERFQYFGFPSQNIRVVSFGDTRPLEPNQDRNGMPILENNQLNRRAVIKVIEPLDKRPAVRLGLGVYFDQEQSVQDID